MSDPQTPRPSARPEPRYKSLRSSLAIGLLVAGVLATSGTAAALLSGAAAGGSSSGVSSASAGGTASAGCPSTSSTTASTISAPSTASAAPLATKSLATASPRLRLAVDPYPDVTVTSMYPTEGLPSGGTPVTITGSGFATVDGTSFWGTAASTTSTTLGGAPGLWAVFDFGQYPSGAEDLVEVNSVIESNTTIYIPSTPPAQNNTTIAEVYLVTPAAFAEVTTIPWQKLPTSGGWFPVGAFTYTNNPPPTTTSTSTTTTSTTTTSTTTPTVVPIVNAVDPPSAYPTGGTPLVIVGTNFEGATSVIIGTTTVTKFTVVNAGLISVVAPPGTGTVDVQVTNAAGTSATSTADQLKYTTALPEVKKAACPSA